VPSESVLTQPVTEIEHRVVLPTGRMRWLHRSSGLFLTGPVKFQNIKVVGRDITDKVVGRQEIPEYPDEKEQ